jgi:ribonuclease VapC
MFIDTSALVAILAGEPDAKSYADAIEAAPQRFIAAHVLLEASMVLPRRLDRTLEEIKHALDEFITVAAIEIMPTTDRHGREAVEAFRRFGKGRGHPARLNLGDCLSYACAKAGGHPLLFKGDDFRLTDVAPAIGRI